MQNRPSPGRPVLRCEKHHKRRIGWNGVSKKEGHAPRVTPGRGSGRVPASVSYTHLDVYKRQLQNNTNNIASDILKNVDADNNEIALTDIPVKAVVVTEVK